MTATLDGVHVQAAETAHQREILTPDALAFIAGLQRQFNPTRERLLAARAIWRTGGSRSPARLTGR
jgi:malate synthase